MIDLEKIEHMVEEGDYDVINYLSGMLDEIKRQKERIKTLETYIFAPGCEWLDGKEDA